MPRPKLVSDEQITSAARHVFMRLGINAPVSLVARALGVTPAALFHRTGSKEQLFVMALTRVDPRQFRLLKLLREGPAPDHPMRSQLVEILTRLGAHLAIVSANQFLLFAAGKLKRGRHRAVLPRRTRRGLTDWLLRARQIDSSLHFLNAAVTAEALVGSIEARHMYAFLQDRQTSVRQEQRFARHLVEGLLGPCPIERRVAKPERAPSGGGD